MVAFIKKLCNKIIYLTKEDSYSQNKSIKSEIDLSDASELHLSTDDHWRKVNLLIVINHQSTGQIEVEFLTVIYFSKNIFT